MITNNALLDPQAPPATQRGIHLIYSRNRQPQRQMAMQTNFPASDLYDKRGNHGVATLTLALAAVIAPVVWICHELLHLR